VRLRRDRSNQMMRPRMTRPKMKPPIFTACVMIGNVGSATPAGGLLIEKLHYHVMIYFAE
jgi:hypothetical protein